MWKLRFSKPIYYSGNNKTVCVYTCTLLATSAINNEYYEKKRFKVVGEAYKHPDDSNDPKLGKIIADSRAKRVAYQKAKDYMAGEDNSTLIYLKRALAEMLNELSFIYKLEELRDKEAMHIKEVIDKIKD